MMIFVIVLSIFGAIFAADNKCYQCATENLREDWAATGLPYYPNDLHFGSDCHTPTLTTSNVSEICSSSCFELLLPIKDTYAMLRGCHAHFSWPEFVVNGNESHTCEYNKIDNLETVSLFGDGTAKNAYAAIAFCKKPTDDESTIPCNSRIVKGSILEASIDSCRVGSTVSCKKCDYYDGDGSCSSDTGNQCQGAYCTKTQGGINGHNYASRGCSAFNPFWKDTCSWTDQSFNVSTGSSQVQLPFRATQCFCKGELCNSAPLTYSTLLPLIVTFLIVRIF